GAGGRGGARPRGAALGLLVAGRGKTVSREAAEQVLAKVPPESCPCSVTIYVTLPGANEHNLRRCRIGVVGDGYHGLLRSDRTKVPGLVSLYDIAPTVEGLERRETPPITSRASSNPERALAKLDRRLADAHDSRGPAAYVVFGLGTLFALLALLARSGFWGRAAL